MFFCKTGVLFPRRLPEVVSGHVSNGPLISAAFGSQIHADLQEIIADQDASTAFDGDFCDA
jgi:hypothetical protein